MFHRFFYVGVVLISHTFAEAIIQENMGTYETSITWNIVYPKWHEKAVESHKNFCRLIHANNDEKYEPYIIGITLSDDPAWINSIQKLPAQLDGRKLISDMMTTMVINLDYYEIDRQTHNDLTIHLATTSSEKEDWINIGSAAIGAPKSGMHRMFHDIFQDTSNQFEFLVGYTHTQPVVSAVIFYEKNCASIYWVCTIPEQRRKGWGRSIMMNALERARKRNIKQVILQAQPMGERIYRGLGFIPIGYMARY